ncbi:serine protease 1-like [Limanda limanda]|uniref:serine protease 1-like n=1 Tax=Limanda limanda TaxID=27771 RepID=UPI0029C952F2|nr:serine protease 1-like [Limanda limanda]
MARLTTLLFAMWLGVTVSTVVDLEKRILGGRECGPNERQYHVKLMTNGDFCGGSLITDRWILTAGHCFKQGGTFTAHIGGYPGPPKKVGIKDPPEFLNDGEEHDLMLLKLPEAVDIKPVQVPTINILPRANGSAGLSCVGLDISVCKTFKALKDQHFICTQTLLLGIHPGDTGGGVMYQDMIYGVISQGYKNSVAGSPIWAMGLCYGPYKEWIKKTTAQPRANLTFG